MDNAQIMVQIHCQNLPGSEAEGRSGVRLGIQKGNAVIDDVSSDVPSVVFTAPLKVSINLTTGKPNFTGPFAHGTPEERFIYLCWGERNQGEWQGFKRVKIHLRPLSCETVESAIKSGQPIKAVVTMTDDKGRYLCASVKDDKIHWEQ